MIEKWKNVFMTQFSDRVLASDETVRMGWDSSTLTQYRNIHLHDLPKTGLVIQPKSAKEIAAIVQLAHDFDVSVIARGGGSGVVEGVFPHPRSVILDLSGLTDMSPLDTINGHITVEAGVNARVLEDTLSNAGWTLGHWPQSIHLASVGGLIATKSNGQYSTHYGGIEDMVRSLEVVTGTGDIIHVGHATPRRTAGPELLPLFIGSEGTLGIVTQAMLKIWPKPESERGLSVILPNFVEGLELMRLWVQTGLSPSVLRLYDPAEAGRTFALSGGQAVLLAVFHGTSLLTEALIREASRLAVAHGQMGQSTLIQHWFDTRNDVSAWLPLLQQGLLADTIEVSANWDTLDTLYQTVIDRVSAIPGVLGITGHSSHAYSDGANLYFTFLASPPCPSDGPSLYHTIWQSVIDETLRLHGSSGHHHGVGRLRPEAIKKERVIEMPYLEDLRRIFDPHRILNRGALWTSQ